MSKNATYKRVQNLNPARSVFDLSYSKTFTCDMGQLFPVMCDEVVPGDFFKIGNQAIIRFQPIVAPVLHEINVFVHYFFVPYRLLWEDWEDFITGGPLGDDASVQPRWITPDITSGMLWDALGFPIDNAPVYSVPVDYPRRAYNLIYNEYYRDQNIQDEVDADNENILNRNWEKDYFSSALPWQQRGQMPALPVTISGTGQADFSGMIIQNGGGASTLSVYNAGNDPTMYLTNNNAFATTNLRNILTYGNTVDLADATATTFDIADLRLALQIQKFLERNARSGARYTEFLKAHFGVSPNDDRLQRPEYIGGSKSPVIISEVLQTSETNSTAQGNLAGHGISISSTYCGKYHAKEFGLIMGIMSVMPKPVYQQGLDRQWVKGTRYDYYFPEFANLSEQPILNQELYVTGVLNTDSAIFGYQGRYDEYRTKKNIVCMDMRDTYDYWHLSRQFTSTPQLSTEFITCSPIDTKRIFAVPSEPGLVVNFGNIIKAFRPMPVMAEPSL